MFGCISRSKCPFLFCSLVIRSAGFRLGRRRSGKLRSFFSGAIAPEPFLRESPLTLSVRGSALLWQTLIYLVRIPRRKGHSIQRDVWLACTISWRKSPHPRWHSSWPKREGSRVASSNSDRTTGSNLRLLVSPSSFSNNNLVRYNTRGLGGG